MKYFSILCIVVLLSSCGGPKPIVDYDRNATFSAYKTYNVFPDIKTELSQLDEKRLLEALDEAMAQEGFTKSNAPDIYVNIFTQQFEDVNRNTIGIGVGGGGGNVGVGVSGGIPIGSTRTNYLQMTVDFIDVANDDLFWQAKLEEKFKLNAKPETRAAFFEKVMLKALKEYPPETN